MTLQAYERRNLMRDDWKTIYGEEVEKTGEFDWLADYAEDRVPTDADASMAR